MSNSILDARYPDASVYRLFYLGTDFVSIYLTEHESLFTKKSGSASFYSHPVEANSYVDSKFIHTYIENINANLKKYSAKYNVYNNQNKFHFSYNLPVLGHKTLN